MGNRVYLYTLSQALPSPYLWLDTTDHLPNDVQEKLSTLKFAEICDTNSTGIPIPWMLYFGLEDFQPALVVGDEDEDYDDEDEDEDEKTDYVLQMPCTSVEKARQRIQAALPVFERLVGDPVIARGYWQEAIDVLSRLPFEYLAMNHIEWLCLSGDEDFEATFETFKAAYLNGTPSDDFLVEYSGFSKGVRPYSHEEWDRVVTRFNSNDSRQMNAIAMGYGHSAYSALSVQER